MDNIELDKFCTKYFEDIVKPKHLSKFEQKTPHGNSICGYICHKPNKFLGSIVIARLNDKPVEQFVQAFPKIHYWDSRHQLKDEGIIHYACNEKLDGTCLIIYPLKDEKGNVIELVPRTREMAVADNHILDMYSLIDKNAIYNYFEGYSKECSDVLMFELYGTLNRHEITYMDTYIDIKLIGMYVDNKFLTNDEMALILDSIVSLRIKPLLYINKGINESEFRIEWDFSNCRIFPYEFEIDDTFPTLYDAIQEVKAILEKINTEYYSYNNRSLVEGVVINGIHVNGSQMYLKIKPTSIEYEARQKRKIPRRFILKEVRKYFDEYGSEVKRLYEEDENHYLDYVSRNLKEEFGDKAYEPRTKKKIKKCFHGCMGF